MNELSLMSDGKLQENFDSAMKLVMSNISDERTVLAKDRVITIKVKIKPVSENREITEVTFDVSTKLVGRESITIFGKIEPIPGGYEFEETKKKQQSILDMPESGRFAEERRPNVIEKTFGIKKANKK